MSILSKTTLSALDLSIVLRHGTPADSFKRTLSLAQHVEKLDYKRFWLAEHHNMDGIASSATALLIGFVAGGTRSIRVGSGGIMLPNHSPLVVAEQFGTLESLYPGRIDLGLGRAPGTDRTTMIALRRDMSSHGEDFAQLISELEYYFAPVSPGQKVQAVPGSGLNVPLWILGSSLYSARLAAALGRPYSFAGHFAPDMMLQAIKLYKKEFMPSVHLKKPYVMVGVPVIAADTDAEAEFHATSGKIRFLNLIRGQSILLDPPVDSMNGLWSEQEKQIVDSKLYISAIGGPDKVRRHLEELITVTEADELIINSDLYHHEARLRSYEIVAQLHKS